MAGPPFAIEDAIHLTADDWMAAHMLRSMGAQAHGVGHELGWGPCTLRAFANDRIRRAFRRRLTRPGGYVDPERWRATSILVPGDVRALPRRPPLVVWTAPTWRNVPAAWFLAHALVGAGVDRGRLWLAIAEGTFQGSILPLPALDESGLFETFCRARPISEGWLATASHLWTLYASDDPRPLDQARREGLVPLGPAFAGALDAWGALFPRRLPGGRSGLSILDEFLLSRFDGRWRFPEREVVEWSEEEPELVIAFLGYAAFLHRRIADWTTRPSGEPALRRRQDARGRLEVALTPAGTRLLRSRLDRVEDAPPLPTGGAVAYAAPRPWIRVDTRRTWRLVMARDGGSDGSTVEPIQQAATRPQDPA